MKEMKYTTTKKIEILDKGNYNGFNYYIMNLGTHPTAYIELPQKHKLFNKNYYEISEIINLDVNRRLNLFKKLFIYR